VIRRPRRGRNLAAARRAHAPRRQRGRNGSARSTARHRGRRGGGPPAADEPARRGRRRAKAEAPMSARPPATQNLPQAGGAGEGGRRGEGRRGRRRKRPPEAKRHPPTRKPPGEGAARRAAPGGVKAAEEERPSAPSGRSAASAGRAERCPARGRAARKREDILFQCLLALTEVGGAAGRRRARPWSRGTATMHESKLMVAGCGHCFYMYQDKETPAMRGFSGNWKIHPLGENGCSLRL